MALVLALTAGCARSGDVVVVIDSTMRAGPVEVVAMPVASSAAAPEVPRAPAAASDSARLLTSTRDSAATLDARFRALRDTLTRDVAMLDTADRSTPVYASKYADIRRRTLVAESVRSSRDSLRRREETLRAALGARAPAPEPTSGGTSVPASRRPDDRTTVRAMTVDGRVTLSLAPGRWSIGLTAPGPGPTLAQSVTVQRGTTQTVRIPPARSRPEP